MVAEDADDLRSIDTLIMARGECPMFSSLAMRHSTVKRHNAPHTAQRRKRKSS
jgi:hypothetical protein